jgi:proteasome-associated ATPase
MLLGLPGEDLAHILVGGAEYYANVDPRVASADLKIGTQILVNEAYAVIKTLGYDRNGPILKLTEAMADGRLRFEQEMGRQSLILQRSSDLAGVELKAGDEVRIDSSLRIAIEKLADRKAAKHVLDEAPNVTWEQIGGQQEAIAAIRKAIEYPLLHASTFEQFKFSQPKGFLLYGPPGCGKTLIGQAAAASLSKLVSESAPDVHGTGDARAPITGGAFLHVAWRIGAHGARSVRAGESQAPRGGTPIHLYRRSRVHPWDEAGHAVVQHLQYLGADVLQRNGRHRVPP